MPPSRVTIAHSQGSFSTSAVTLSRTLSQSPRLGCLNSRAVGYHGLSSRSCSHLQSAANGRSIHTGLPSAPARCAAAVSRSEEHTSELQSRLHLVCRLLLEKKKHQRLHVPSPTVT